MDISKLSYAQLQCLKKRLQEKAPPKYGGTLYNLSGLRFSWMIDRLSVELNRKSFYG